MRNKYLKVSQKCDYKNQLSVPSEKWMVRTKFSFKYIYIENIEKVSKSIAKMR